jgi:FkbM family methyltransferase
VLPKKKPGIFYLLLRLLVFEYSRSRKRSTKMGDKDKRLHQSGTSRQFAIFIGVLVIFGVFYAAFGFDRLQLTTSSLPTSFSTSSLNEDLVQRIVAESKAENAKLDEMISLLREIVDISSSSVTAASHSSSPSRSAATTRISTAATTRRASTMEASSSAKTSSQSSVSGVKSKSGEIAYHGTSRCAGQPVVIGGDVIAFRHAFRKDFDVNTAASSPDFVKLKWGRGTKMMTHGRKDSISDYLLDSGVWEAQNMMIAMAVADHFVSTGKPLTFLDVGSNIGLFGLLMAGYGHTVFMFEPIARNLERICESVELNGYGDRITVVPAGVAEKRKDLSFYVPDTNFGNSRSVDEGSSKAPGVALDEIWPSLNIPDDHSIFIKVDVEGFEMFVADGAKRVFSMPNVIGIMFEHDSYQPPEMSYRMRRLKEIKELGGFGVYCCAKCQDVSDDHGRCAAYDITDEDFIRLKGQELMFIRPEYFDIVDQFSCWRKEYDKCQPPTD